MSTSVKGPPALSTFAIGSLPHTQQELAMQQQLQLDIPTLPQLPRMDASEFMLPEALEGLPGLRSDPEGGVQVDVSAWKQGASAFGAKLEAALRGDGLEAFEPSPTTCRSWLPFLWEIEQRKPAFAKAQLAGPLTCSWAAVSTEGKSLASEPELVNQIVRLVVVRSLAMTKAIAAAGATPIMFLDEPGLFAFDSRRLRHVVELRELSIAAQALRAAGAITGVHCCGNTDWAMVLGLGFDIVSADVRLSLAAIIESGGLETFLAGGGRLGLGIVPTSAIALEPAAKVVEEALKIAGDRAPQILRGALLSPACGLALRTVAESERVYAEVRQAQRLIRERVA